MDSLKKLHYYLLFVTTTFNKLQHTFEY